MLCVAVTSSYGSDGKRFLIENLATLLNACMTLDPFKLLSLFLTGQEDGLRFSQCLVISLIVLVGNIVYIRWLEFQWFVLILVDVLWLLMLRGSLRFLRHRKK